MVSRFVEATNGRLKLFLLPGYSPELTPDELVWNSLKNGELGRKIHTTKEQMKRTAISHLRRLQQLPERIRSYIQKPRTIYATRVPPYYSGHHNIIVARVRLFRFYSG